MFPRPSGRDHLDPFHILVLSSAHSGTSICAARGFGTLNLHIFSARNTNECSASVFDAREHHSYRDHDGAQLNELPPVTIPNHLHPVPPSLDFRFGARCTLPRKTGVGHIVARKRPGRVKSWWEDAGGGEANARPALRQETPARQQEKGQLRQEPDGGGPAGELGVPQWAEAVGWRPPPLRGSGLFFSGALLWCFVRAWCNSERGGVCCLPTAIALVFGCSVEATKAWR